MGTTSHVLTELHKFLIISVSVISQADRHTQGRR